MFQEGRTALLVACWRGFLPIVIMLIKSGANTNAQDQVLYDSVPSTIQSIPYPYQAVVIQCLINL